MLNREVKRRFKSALVPALYFAVIGYFSYHIIQGNHGIRAKGLLDQRLNEASWRLAKLKAINAQLEKKVRLLKPASICPDLLEQQAKEMLGYSSPNEIIILHHKWTEI